MGFVLGLCSKLVLDVYSGLALSLYVSLAFTVIYGLSAGWQTCSQHLILRILLWRTGCTPLNYIRFLDYAVERLLLRKVGGGYIFIHRLLLEYLVGLDGAAPSSSDSPR